MRQLCWRDFYAQLLRARPEPSATTCAPAATTGSTTPIARGLEGGHDRVPARRCRHAPAARGGLDAQPRPHGAASFLVKDLGIDWREGARHFFDLLLDGDVAQNIGNWQWVAGTGVDTRPNRIYIPTRAVRKLDPDGDYVRRYVPELADVPARDIAEPGCSRRPTRRRSSTMPTPSSVPPRRG